MEINLRDVFFEAEYRIDKIISYQVTKGYVEYIVTSENGTKYILSTGELTWFSDKDNRGYYRTEREAIERAKHKAIDLGNGLLEILEKEVTLLRDRVKELYLTTEVYKHHKPNMGKPSIEEALKESE